MHIETNYEITVQAILEHILIDANSYKNTTQRVMLINIIDSAV
jgi:hypothetical protein